MEALSARALLGCGGHAPRVESFDPHSGETRELTRFDVGHSAYVLDRNKEVVLVGTKTGHLCWLRSAEGETEPPTLSYRVDIGASASILAACFVSDCVVAVADTTGRCRVLDSHAENTVCELPTNGHTICALNHAAAQQLVGLTTERRVLIWDVADGTLTMAAQAPSPPPCKALVRLVALSGERVVMYVAEGGELVTFSLSNGKVTTRRAHAGYSYATSECNIGLITVGYEDCLLKVWKPLSAVPVCEIACPAGVTSVASLDGDMNRVLLVYSSGKADIFKVSTKQLHHMSSLPGDGYRVVLEPEYTEVERSHTNRSRIRASHLAAAITDTPTDAASASEAHSELVDIGYGHVSLALRAQQAERNDDILVELDCRTQLHAMLMESGCAAGELCVRYAELLESLWLIEEALSIRKLLAKSGAHTTNQSHLEWLTVCREKMRTPCWVATSELPPSSLVAAAAQMEIPFRGRWLVTSLPPLTCRGSTISASMIAAKYKEIRSPEHEQRLPPARPTGLWSISEGGCSRKTAVLFTSDAPGFELVLSIGQDGYETVVTPLKVFSAGEPHLGRTAAQHADMLLNLLREEHQNDGNTGAGLDAVYRDAIQAIRRILTRNITAEMRGRQ